MIAVAVMALAGVILLVPGHRVSEARLRRIGASAGTCVCAAAVALIVCPVPAMVIVAATAGAVAPVWVRSQRRTTARVEQRAQWPDAIDSMRAAVRSGATVAEAVAEPARQGGAALLPRFEEYRRRLATGEAFDSAVTALTSPDDAVSERVVTILRLGASEGSADIGRVLASLSSFVRSDLAAEREVAARQHWNIVAARLAVAAPWLTVAALSAHPSARTAYSSPSGSVVLAIVLVVSAAAYALMVRVARGGGRRWG